MVRIKFLLEYHCLPIWLYSCKGELISNGLTPDIEIEIGNNISEKLERLKKEYDKLFEDNEITFEYKGFSNDNKRRAFICQAEEIIELIKSKTASDFTFEVKTDLTKL